MNRDDRNFHFSSVEFRPDPSDPAASMHLGWLLEFTTPDYWVVGLAMRAVVDPNALARLDPLSRELVENRANLFGADIGQALRGAAKPGDVLNALSRANPWSVHITKPAAIEIDRKTIGKNVSIEQALEQYVLSVYRRAVAADRPAEQRGWFFARLAGQANVEPLPAGAPADIPPPPWMLPAKHWARPLIAA